MNIESILITSTAFCLLLVAIIISFRSKRVNSQLFSMCLAFIAIWSIDISLSYVIKSEYVGGILTRIDHALGILITYFLFLFSRNISRPKVILFYTNTILSVVITLLIIFSDGLIANYEKTGAVINSWDYGVLFFPYLLVFMTNFISSLYLLYTTRNPFDKETSQRKILITSIIVGVVPPLITCIIIPKFGYFDLIWFGPVSSVLFIIPIGYGIYRYSLFKMRAVMFEIVLLCIWITIFIHSIQHTEIIHTKNELVLLAVIILLSVLLAHSTHEKEKYHKELEEITEVLKKIDECITIIETPRK